MTVNPSSPRQEQQSGDGMLPGGWRPPEPRPRLRGGRAGMIALLIGGTLLGIGSLVLVVPFLLENTGPGGFVAGFLLSLIPLTVVLLAVYFVDRWEPEPRRLLVFALSWGAAVSIAATTLIQPLFISTFGPRGADDARMMEFLATVEAPVVEEFSKSLGLLVLMLVARKYFDGPVDGVVYGMTIAAGFAFTENILYFGRLYAETDGSTASLTVLFIMRGILSPFAHAMFTATTGLIMGFAARRWNPALAVGAFLVGLVPAMLLHNIWNGAGEDFFLIYVLVEVPLFALAIVGLYLLRRADARSTHRTLSEYAEAGWLAPLEVEMLATPRGRSAGLRWAASRGRRSEMQKFIRVATDLAYTRQRALSGRDTSHYQQNEEALLLEIGRSRAAVTAL